MGLRVLKLAKQTNRSFRWLLKGFQPLDHDATPPTGLKPQFKNKGEPGSALKAHKLPLRIAIPVQICCNRKDNQPSDHLAVIGSTQSNIDLSEFVLNAAHQHCRRTKTIRRGPRRVSPEKVDQEEGFTNHTKDCLCVVCEGLENSNSHCCLMVLGNR